MREISFSPTKAIESIIYLASKLSKPTIHEVLKLRYFADKLHLSKYGSIASGDIYYAMKFGPVASNTYNLLRAARGDKNNWIHPAFFEAVANNLVVEDEKHVRTLRDANLNFLAESDVECLSEAIDMYGNMPFDQRTALSHDAAWNAAWEAASADSLDAGNMSVRDIVATLENASELLEHIAV